MKPTIRVRKWSEFQHYKGRTPPWIKLHRRLLKNREWDALTGDAAKLLIELWLLAAESRDGTVDGATDDLAWERRRRTDSVASLLIELETHGFLDLSVHDACTVVSILPDNNLGKNASNMHQVAPDSAPESEVRSQKSERELTPTSDRAKKKRAMPTYASSFLTLWTAHPRGSKAQASKAYDDALARGVAHELMATSLERYVREKVRADFDGVHLFRWIRDSRWEEYEVDRQVPMVTPSKPHWERAKEEAEQQAVREFHKRREGYVPVIVPRPRPTHDSGGTPKGNLAIDLSDFGPNGGISA